MKSNKQYINLNTINSQYYEMACEYMAKTELYDRSLTNCRSPWDKTEAFLNNPHVKRLSNEYAAQLRKYYSKICGGTWQFIHNEIHKHTKYSAQMWINEWNRIRAEEGLLDET